MNPDTPEGIYPLFNRYFSAGTVDLLLTLYQEDAVMIPAPGQRAEGKEAIREAINSFLALNGTFNVGEPIVVRSGDTALLTAKWTLTGTGPDGKPMKLEGQTSDVVRRQADGKWLFAIDCPFGAESFS